jgi:hypothetical protein
MDMVRDNSPTLFRMPDVFATACRREGTWRLRGPNQGTDRFQTSLQMQGLIALPNKTIELTSMDLVTTREHYARAAQRGCSVEMRALTT